LAAVESAVTAGATTQDLYSQYSRQIYSYCLHKLRSREEAEDAVQTTFMNAFRSLQRGATTQFEQAWLFKIAQNVCFARQTSSSKRMRLEAPNDFEMLQEIVPSPDGEQPLELMGLEEALEQMPENQRRAILLREWQGLSYREISDELGLSQAAVEMLIFRARRTLAGALDEPEEARGKKIRAGRKVGALGSLIGALKTLFGGGAAIKAVTIAAAAIAVVGESANHTIVHPLVVVKAAPASAVAAEVSASATSRAHEMSTVAGSPTAAAPVDATHHVARAHSAVNAGAVASHAHGKAHPRAAGQVVAAAVPRTVVAPAPATPSVTTTSAPVPAPAPTPPAAAPAAPPVHQDPPKKDERQTTSFSPPVVTATQTPVTPTAPVVTTTPQPSPGNGSGNAYGRNKDKGDPAAAPVVTAPVVTAPVDTAPVVTPTPSPTALPPAPPASDDHGNGHGNGTGPGHDK
jgi:RNA polymerase sigma factor (sigma-70 family)